MSLVVAPVVAYTTRRDRAPTYHIAFAYFGFVIAISWIYTIANEVVALLKAIGIIFNLSQFILGITFLAWGNSIGGKERFVTDLNAAAML